MMVRLAILCFLLSTMTAFAQSGCIAGQVLDDSGSPLPQMHVTVRRQIILSVALPILMKTGGSSYSDLPAGSYRIFSRNENLGYTFSNNTDFSGTVEELQVVVPASADCAQVRMRREPRAGKLRLKLTDLFTGKEIEKPEANFRRVDGFHAWEE